MAMKIDQATSATLAGIWTELEPRVERAKCLEEAAQEMVAALQTKFDESVVIARAFVTVPFAELPPSNKEFVLNLAKSAGAEAELKATTPVLSLIGTCGKEADWKDRRKSKGHVGIPLISSAFVGAIPMISRLLNELGIPLEWADSHDTEVIVKSIGSSAGLFFVEDAASATDSQGRKVIAAQDFVSDHKVRSVFGIGGAYLGGQMLVLVVFCRDVLSRGIAERFLEVANLFKGKTLSLATPAKVFRPEG
jgi:hypothetical protein